MTGGNNAIRERTMAELSAMVTLHDLEIRDIDGCLERDSRNIVTLRSAFSRMECETDRSIALVHLVLAMVTACSVGALTVSLLGAVA